MFFHNSQKKCFFQCSQSQNLKIRNMPPNDNNTSFFSGAHNHSFSSSPGVYISRASEMDPKRRIKLKK